MRLVAVCLVALAYCGAHASDLGQRTLTFEDRVAAQKAIEQVYWNHRIWPKEIATPKPPLSAVTARAQGRGQRAAGRAGSDGR